MLVLKMNFKNKKIENIYYFNIFLNKKYVEKQPLLQYQTDF
jgi:hypothetical protein